MDREVPVFDVNRSSKLSLAPSPREDASGFDDIYYYSSLAEGDGTTILLDPNGKRRFSESADRFTASYVFDWNASPGFVPRPVSDITGNLAQEMQDPGKVNSIYRGNISAMILSVGGEAAERGFEQIYYYSHKVPAVKGALDVVGTAASYVTGGVHYAGSSIGKSILAPETTDDIEETWDNLPRGIKFIAENVADGGVLWGAGKLAANVSKISAKTLKGKAPSGVEAFSGITVEETAVLVEQKTAKFAATASGDIPHIKPAPQKLPENLLHLGEKEEIIQKISDKAIKRVLNEIRKRPNNCVKY